ncbi:hypothetical protein LO762_28765 [Actinocorallia sp. API 0066]|uniref:hypothetical protein n=1 Tax=Actinocorallia sp. API 0066 TaxID=2896846 RepID=UPI001E290306|nr:hypothetical protein [Actinocorallia sp. API 0066]MCD0453142.1 hypothetical protein [Actinocorallia sp. API 0066]
MTENTFAIPLPGHGSTRVGGSDTYLDPHGTPDHAKLYADLDHMGIQIRKFKEKVGTGRGTTDESRIQGYLVLVGGADGSGRSSLIHCCLAHLAENLPPAGNLSPTIVNLSTRWGEYDQIPRLTADQSMAEAIMSGVISSLPKPENDTIQTSFDSLGLGNISDREEAPSTRFHNLNEYLKMNDSYLFLLTPKPPESTRGQAFNRLLKILSNMRAHSRISVFMEVTQDELEEAQRVREVAGRPGSIFLRIGALAEDDCHAFARRRTEAGVWDNPLRVDLSSLCGMGPDVRFRTVRELQEVFHGAADLLLSGQGRVDAGEPPVLRGADVVTFIQQRNLSDDLEYG